LIRGPSAERDTIATIFTFILKAIIDDSERKIFGLNAKKASSASGEVKTDFDYKLLPLQLQFLFQNIDAIFLCRDREQIETVLAPSLPNWNG
jgi:hypothetical protein